MDFVKILLYALSPGLRKEIVEFVKSLDVKASKTKYPLDEVIVGIFRKILDIKD